MVKKKVQRHKQLGRTISDPSRRFTYDAGGRRPLTEFPLCPITVAMPEDVKKKIMDLSELFIDPSLMKPYGSTAVCRVILAIMLFKVDQAPREEMLEYFKAAGGVAGRPVLSERTRRVSMLIPAPFVQRINDRVFALNEPVIGTATVIRWLLINGLKWIRHYHLYEHIPTAHMVIILKEKLTIDSLVALYQARKSGGS